LVNPGARLLIRRACFPPPGHCSTLLRLVGSQKLVIRIDLDEAQARA